MPILIVVALVPTLSFYFYALAQFWAEAKRRRHHDTCAMIVPLHTVRPVEAEQDRHTLNDEGGANTPAYAAQSLAPAAVVRSSQGPVRANLLSPYLKNRILAISSRTGHLSAKHAAKG